MKIPLQPLGVIKHITLFPAETTTTGNRSTPSRKHKTKFAKDKQQVGAGQGRVGTQIHTPVNIKAQPVIPSGSQRLGLLHSILA